MRHQVGERLFASRIARQYPAIVLHRFGVPAGLLQGDGLGKQRLLVLREPAPGTGRAGPGGVRLRRRGSATIASPSSASERVPSASMALRNDSAACFQLLEMALADSQVEVRGAVQRLQFHQLPVDCAGSLIVVHL